ncbi:MAG: hypothetical protein NUW23_16300 [Firmicutes bacterium]|jgi:hypothetical protein|nr:hypothetical protein [Bacillota bacterium]
MSDMDLSADNVVSLQKQVSDIEAQVRELQSRPGKLEEALPRTRILSPSFLTRAFAV